MKERESIVVGGLVALMLILWLGFLVHRSPRFAGSLWGGMLGVGAALVMLVPLAYMIVKRTKALRRALQQRVSMRTLLAWHIYAGLGGPILALLHTGHKFESPLGIALTSMMLSVAVSGFIGRYLLNQITGEIREKKDMLVRMEESYTQLEAEVRRQAFPLRRPGFAARLLGSFFSVEAVAEPLGVPIQVKAVNLAESMADLEYAVKTHELFKSWFSKWLKFHILISFIFYILMAFHIWSEVYFGLRWFE